MLKYLRYFAKARYYLMKGEDELATEQLELIPEDFDVYSILPELIPVVGE